MLFRKVIYPIIIFVFISGFVNSASASDPCDRKCLEGYIDKVLAAMLAHNPGQLMLAKNVRYTENGVELIPGDGMWGTLSARGKYNLYVCDMKDRQAGFYGTVSENGKINYIALRVKVDDALISEIELIVARPESTASPSSLSAGQRMEQRSVRPQFLQTITPAERMSREKLIEIASSYFTGLANQEPNPDIPKGGIDILCMSCEEQQKSGWFAFVTEIRNRRFPIVDEERGLVLSFGYFDHDAAVRQYPLPDGTMTPNIVTYPQTIEISELFQIRNAKIDQIEALFNSVPYGMSSEVWDK